jgi:hypothetical protein
MLRKPFHRLFLAFCAFLGALSLFSCTASESEGDQYLTWNLSESLKDYDRVVITLVKPEDTSSVLEYVHDGKLPDPLGFPKYKLKEAKGKDFIVRIRAYNDKNEVLLAKDVSVKSRTSQPTRVLQADLRLYKMEISPGNFDPAFSPNQAGYTVGLPESIESVAFTIVPMDTANVLSVNGQSQPWGKLPAASLGKGDNLYAFKVSKKDGSASRIYQVAVIRGEPTLIDPNQHVESLVIQPKSIKLYTGDSPAILTAAAVPATARVQWSSLNEGAAKVDRFGNVTPVDAGNALIVVRAGDQADTASVQVIKDAPIVSVGSNLAIKAGTEVAFPISVRQEHGTIVAFKYDLDGDGIWDNADSSKVPETLKRTYSDIKSYTARFYVRDSEGNVVTAARTINVTNQALRVSIVWPGRDTAVNTPELTVRYTVNDGVEQVKTFTLKDGDNTLTVEAVNGDESGTATIHVALDSKAPTVIITSPEEGTLTRESSIAVAWTVDGKAQTAQLTEELPSDGERSIIRQWKDSAGNVGADTVRVTRDTKAPSAPKLTGTTPTNTRPKWTWSTGGGGGSAAFRYRLADGNFPADAPETTDTAYTLAQAGVSGTKYVLYVQERDAAGNWSPSSSLEILYNTSAPVVAIYSPQSNGTHVTKAATVTLSGTASGPNPVAKVSYKVDGADKGGAAFANGTWTIADLAVNEGVKTVVTVICTDAIGNTGEGSLTIQRDTTAPGAPSIAASPATPTNASKGSWTWTAGSDGASGSGLNGNYRYALNGGAWKEAPATAVSDLALVEGENAFTVQEQDMAGNWSASATSKVKVDKAGPVVKITSHTGPAASSSIHITLSGTVSDSGTGVKSVVVTGQQSGSGNATVTGGDWTTGDLVLQQNANSLVVTATDNVGNTSTATLAVSVNVNTPQVQIVSPAADFITAKDTVTVKFKVNGKDTSRLFTALAEGSNTLAVSSPPNEVGATGSASVVVYRDSKAPNAPTLTAVKTLTKDDPVWNWTSNGDIAGGAGLPSPGTFQYSVDDGAFQASTATTFTLASAASGAHSLVVREVDKAGNVSANSSKITVTVDKVAPVVAITFPANGFVTNKPSLQVQYTVDGVAAAKSVTLANDGGSDLVTISSDADGAGNVGAKAITVYWRSKVKFVKTAATGAGDGSSWDDAYGNIQTALNAASSGYQVWVAAGTYAAPATANGYTFKSGVSLYGGFAATGYPNSTSGRTLTGAPNTILGNKFGNTVSLAGTGANNLLQDVAINGFLINHEKGHGLSVGYATGISVDNCTIAHVLDQGVSLSMYGSGISFTNTRFTGNQFEGSMINGDGMYAYFTNCEFSGNTFPASYTVLVSMSVADLKFSGTRFKDVHAYPENIDIRNQYKGSNGSFTVSGCYFTAPDLAHAVVNESFFTISSPVANKFSQP